MTARLARLPWLAGVALGLGALLIATFSVRETLDYQYQVAPAMNALLDGDVEEFFRLQPVYGGFAVLARLPFAALARVVAGGNDLLVYQLGAVACVLALAAVALVVTKSMADRDRPPLAQVAVGGLLVMNPVSLAAVQRGHPEELLTCALVLGAVLAATRSHSIWAALLLGLAIGTKQWALLAAAPILLLAGQQLLRRTAIVVAVAAALTVPMAVAAPERFATNNRMAQGGWYHASRLSVWWPLSSPTKVAQGITEGRPVTVHRLPDRLTTFARPAVLVLAVALAFAFWRRRQGLGPEDTLGLLALIMLLRCLLDPTNNDYYHVPFLAFLTAWEGLRTRRLPVLSLVAAAGLWATLRSPWLSPLALGEDFQLVNNAFYLAWTLPLAAWLAFVVFRPPLRDVSVGGSRAGRRRYGLRPAGSKWERTPQSSAP